MYFRYKQLLMLQGESLCVWAGGSILDGELERDVLYRRFRVCPSLGTASMAPLSVQSEGADSSVKKEQLNLAEFRKPFEAVTNQNQLSARSRDEWNDWLSRLALHLIAHSPAPAIRYESVIL